MASFLEDSLNGLMKPESFRLNGCNKAYLYIPAWRKRTASLLERSAQQTYSCLRVRDIARARPTGESNLRWGIEHCKSDCHLSHHHRATDVQSKEGTPGGFPQSFHWGDTVVACFNQKYSNTHPEFAAWIKWAMPQSIRCYCRQGKATRGRWNECELFPSPKLASCYSLYYLSLTQQKHFYSPLPRSFCLPTYFFSPGSRSWIYLVLLIIARTPPSCSSIINIIYYFCFLIFCWGRGK